MKFLQLRSAIEEHPSLAPKQQPNPKRRPKQVAPWKGPNGRTKVECNPTFRPVDRIAARVISPASWIHKPMQTPPNTNTMVSHTGERLYTEKDALRLASEVKVLKKDSIRASASSIDDSADQIHNTAQKIYAALSDLEAVASKHNQSIRALRMASVAEAGQIVKVLNDIRTLFIGPDHTKEMERLSHFISLCERLETLKNNGTLDAVADVILKLGVSK